MTLEDIISPDIYIDIFDKKLKVDFKIRNFAAIKNICGVSETSLLQGLTHGDTDKIVYAIWGSTLKFAPFDPSNPTKIKEELNLEELFNLNLNELQGINKKLIEALTASLLLDDENNAEKKTEPQKIEE